MYIALAFAWLKSHPWLAFDGLSRLLLRLVPFPCHPWPPNACATLTGIDCARDRLWKSPFNMVAELALSGTAWIISVTAEQWAQAEAERQRQAQMVQTLINEVRRLGTEQNNNLQGCRG